MNKFDEAINDLAHERDMITDLAQYLQIPQEHYDTIRTALTLAAEIERGDKVVVDRDQKPILAMYQKYDSDDFDVRTQIDIETLDPYKLLFLWTTFHQSMSQHMLKACGCDDKQPPASEGK